MSQILRLCDLMAFCDLRIDNGGLECMCTWLCVFSDILAIH